MSITHQDDFDHVGQAETMLCDTCDKYRNPNECMEDEYGEVICQSCRENRDEAAYERYQERLMEDGGIDDSKYRRDMIEAGRGHLLR